MGLFCSVLTQSLKQKRKLIDFWKQLSSFAETPSVYAQVLKRRMLALGWSFLEEPMYFLIWNHWYASLPRRRSFRASTLAGPPPPPTTPHPNGKRNAWRSLKNIWVEGQWYARLSRKCNEQFTRKNSTLIGIQNEPDWFITVDRKSV